MDGYGKLEAEATRRIREHEALWVSDIPPEGPPAPPLTEDQARILAERYGGWRRILEGVELLCEAMDRLEPFLRSRGDYPVFLAALLAADRLADQGSEAEPVLQEEGLQSSRGGAVTLAGGTEGRPPTLLRHEVERTYRRMGHPVGKGNTKATRARIREALEARYPAELLTEGKLSGILSNLCKEDRKQVRKRARG